MAAIAAAGVGLMVVCSSSVAAFMMMGDDDDDKKKKTPLGPTGPTGPTGPSPGPAPPVDPCAGLVDDSLASSIPVKCLQKIFKDEGCTEQGTAYPGDDYEGWWTDSPQGTTRVWCDSAGTPCGAGNYADTKADIIAWSTLQDDIHLAGCGRAT
jgi:hypothetical protein